MGTAGVEVAEAGADVGEKRPVVPKVVWATGWVSFFTDLSTELIYGILPAFYAATLHLNVMWLGLVEGTAETIVSISKLLSGHWSDRTGRRKRWMLVGYAMSAMAKPLLGLSEGGLSVLALRGADRLGKGIRGAPRDALLSREVPKALRGRAFGIQRGMDHAGALLGGLVASGLLMSQLVTMRQLFWWSALPGLVAVLVIVIFVHERDPGSASSQGSAQTRQKLSLRAAWRVQPQRVKRYLAVLAIFALSNSSDLLLLKLAYDRFRGAGFSEHVAYGMLPLLWAWLHVIKSGTSLWGGRLSDRVGRLRVIRAGWLIYAGIYLAFAFWTWWVGPWVLFGVYGIYFGLVEAPERALVADLNADAGKAGTAYGLFHFVTAMASLPASLLLAGLWLGVSAQVAFAVGAGLALLAAGLLPWALGGDGDARSAACQR